MAVAASMSVAADTDLERLRRSAMGVVGADPFALESGVDSRGRRSALGVPALEPGFESPPSRPGPSSDGCWNWKRLISGSGARGPLLNARSLAPNEAALAAAPKEIEGWVGSLKESEGWEGFLEGSAA